MLKKLDLKLLALGFLPLLTGVAVYQVRSNILLFLMDFPFLLLWGWLSYRVADTDRTPLPQALALSAVSLLLLTAIAGREVLLGWSVFSNHHCLLPFVFVPSLIAYVLGVNATRPIFVLAVCAIIGGSQFLAAFAGCRLRSIV